jgi:hypothetical protein
VDSRRVVNKGSDDLELGLSVTKNKPAGVGALLSGRPELANHRVNELFFARPHGVCGSQCSFDSTGLSE